MKLYIMKQEVLDFLKENLEILYGKYYSETTNAWIKDMYGEDPFVEFKEVTEFKLADLDAGLTPGEIDLINCKTIYEKLNFLSESQASDERFWAGLTHSVFYDYMRRRWKYGFGNIPQSSDREASAIRTRFFYSGTGRSGFYRNTLAKCWWVGRNTYDPSNITNHFEALDVIGANDLNSKITEFFYNFTFSSNPILRAAIIDSLRDYKTAGKKLLVKEHIRPAMSYLNAVGGSVVLDCLERDEISSIFSSAIDAIMQGDTPVLSDVIIDINYEEYDDSEMQSNRTMNKDFIEDTNESHQMVALGCTITIVNLDGETHYYKYDFIDNKKWPPILDVFTDKVVGDVINLNNEEWTISQISFGE